MAVLYLLPAYLGETSPREIFSPQEISLICKLKYFTAENEKSARKFIKYLCPDLKQSELTFSILDKRTTETEIEEIARPLKDGENVGLISEAGLPCIADPGNILVAWAHRHRIKVVPVSGASSIILALIASGLNGQNFAFNGYLPIDAAQRRKAIQNLENLSKIHASAQIFMETPYRNHALFDDLLKTLHPQTELCIATHITLPDESIKTLTLREWKKEKPDFHKKPTIFIIQA
ncbi:MAG: SAM-dependent methyltransferase [Flavobacteriaceae bacterium]|jgi:16S rRNA (cytidine1402-2'-O)-methyltransferase|nr:SAM-dependent methyltransferase [Flavobacteriaceae bacterium]